MLNEDKKLKIKRAIQIGATIEIACSAAGVSYENFLKWLSTNEGQFFQDEIQQLSKIDEDNYFHLIEKSAANGNESASAWLRVHGR